MAWEFTSQDLIGNSFFIWLIKSVYLDSFLNPISFNWLMCVMSQLIGYLISYLKKIQSIRFFFTVFVSPIKIAHEVSYLSVQIKSR